MTHAPDRTAPLLAEAAWVHRLARALLHDPDLAADVAQEALVAAIEQQPRFDGQAQLRGWLRTVIRRIAGAARRGERERVQRERRTARPEGQDAEHRAQEQLALHRDLTAAVQALPEPYRTAVTLRFLADLPPRAIARQCATSSEVVRQRVHRGLDLLRQRLDRDHGSRAAWAAPFAAALPVAVLAPYLAVPLMAKQALAVAAVLVAAATGTWLVLPDPAPPPLAEAHGATATPMALVADPRTAATATATASETVAAESARLAAEFAVLVVDAHDAAVAGVLVHCWVDGDEPLLRRTDAAGLAHFMAAPRAGGLVVAATGRAPQLVRIAALQGTQRVQLSFGRAVAGQLLVDGVPAPPGIRLELQTTRPDDPTLPPTVRELFASAAIATTVADGWFAFRGLTADWHGDLRLPQTHWLLPTPTFEPVDDRDLPLPRPDEHLLVPTTRLPTAEGHVVWADDGAPVANAQIMANAEFDDASSSVATSAAADADGAFAIALLPMVTTLRERWRVPTNRPHVTSVHLLAGAPGSGGHHRFEFDATAQAAPGGLVVRLPRPPLHCFVARDPRGAPVPLARVLGDELSAPADALGRGTFVGTAQLVGAPGHAIVAAPASTADGTADDPLAFVLVPGGELRLQLCSDAGGAPAVRRVRLRAPEPIFDGPPLGGPLHRALATGLSGGSFERAGGPIELLLNPDPTGLILLPSPRPDVPFTLSIRDALGLPLLERELRTPAAGGAATITLDVPAPRRVVHGLVRGDDQQPLGAAILRLRRLGQKRFDASVKAEADGTFAFAPTVDDGPLELRAEAGGWSSEIRVLAAGAEVAEFRLARGRRIEVRVIDTAGTLLPIDRGLCVRRRDAVDPIDVPMQVLEPGRYAFANLPPRDVTFHCKLGGRAFALPIDDGATSGTLVLPTPARVTLAPLPRGFALPALGALAVRACRLGPDADAADEPVDLSLRDAAPFLLPPGRYRFVLVRNEWHADQRRTETTELPAAVERTLSAGETTTIALQ